MRKVKTVNLEEGMPRADAAIKRLTYELHNARSLGFTALKLIHGYGSSGTGGVLRVQSRRYLQGMRQRGMLRFIISGEDFSIFDDTTRQAFEACPDLRGDSDLERHNNGVTIVVYK